MRVVSLVEIWDLKCSIDAVAPREALFVLLSYFLVATFACTI